jgi:RNA polymerase sigma-70 factor (ECF subfamily)
MRAAEGDGDAMEELLARSEPGLRQALCGAIGAEFRSALDVDDVIQVTFIEAFLQFGKFSYRGDGSFLAWLRQLAQNNLRDAVKGLKREKRPPRHRAVSIHGDSDSYVDLLAQLGGSTTTPSGASARREAKNLIEAAIGKLPPDYEKIVRLMDLEGLTGAQAAKSMGRSEGAVYMLRMRAHALLREYLGSGGKFFSHGA